MQPKTSKAINEALLKKSLLENHDQINRKSIEYQQIYVDWGIAMTDFTDFVTFCKNQQFVAYFFC